MTEQVRVPAGGSIPPVPANAVVTQHSRELGMPPQGMQPGFVPPAPAPQFEQQTQQPAPAAAPAVDPTIAALLAALSGQPAAQAPAAPAAHNTQAPASGLDSSLNGLLRGAGVDTNRALTNALEYGDANLIDREYIKATAGDKAPYLIAVAEQIVAADIRAEAEGVAAAHAVAGGAANWNAAVGLFNQSAPPHLVAVCKAMADSGDVTQVNAASKLVVEFARANGGNVVPANLLTSQSTVGAAQALSKEQFQAELQKLDRNSRTYEQERNDLFGRRGMGKSLGR